MWVGFIYLVMVMSGEEEEDEESGYVTIIYFNLEYFMTLNVSSPRKCRCHSGDPCRL